MALKERYNHRDDGTMETIVINIRCLFERKETFYRFHFQFMQKLNLRFIL